MSEPILSIEPAGVSKPVVDVPPLSIHKIVVGYENDECGNRALRWAEEIATVLKADLIVTHSVPPPPGVIDIYYEQLKEEVLDEARDKIADAIHRHLQHFDRPIKEVVNFDGPAKLMLRTASETDADLVIVGSHGRKGIDQFLFGSVSESLAFRCTCPVLVCGPECEPPDMRRKTVVFASTPSETSVRAAEYARAIAEYAGVKLLAMHTPAERPPTEAHDRLWKEEYVKELLRIALGEPADDAADITYCVEYGDPAEEVLTLANKEDAALIVIGSGERMVGADHFSWRPTGEILRSAPCPVLVVSDNSK
ncbi:universal stress protein UspA-like protein [Terriglobus roseus DSM 18391]|uniref:Universal stress protein UspA-like protein n=1 Tax=Terriglobus roseus (strain DSM 18391 / NRRL B-41598 / KBS 63) TaxID=926566 RepID=I3ZHS2_TERRK|nr:universal stress protein [Terriglobus roseus]AFL88448.1 universal stress protein UspA-like protein [Terriglobus roseus DSM 18391]AFL88790.1 universal stress protein UspA-like protein [Terriglobus roseus DSM 18391]